ncbi:MAG TPA: hypothetical protein VNW15_01555 [Rhizomicrobium sp.]|nr:hypothetical protein [Rhizomicrobium sp.]
MSVLTHFPPKSRLAELAGRFGGLSREDAVEAATREMQVMRPESDKAIMASIAQMEKIVTGATKRGDAVLMKELLPPCDQIVTLAGTFGYGALDKATRSLCDLLDVLLRENKIDLASIRVHVQTIRMFAPGALSLSAEQIEVMLFELNKLLDHHGFVPGEHGQGSEDAGIAAAK